MWRSAAIGVVALCLVACGDRGVSDGAATIPPGSIEGPSVSATSSAATLPSSTVTEARDTAPDFTLTMGSGDTFVLSEEARPVYLVFWAEW